MARFNVGDIIYVVEHPDKLYKVLNVNTTTTIIPSYNLIGEDGIFFEIFCLNNWRKLVTADEALRYGEVLTNDNLYCELQAEDEFEDYKYVRIRTISYDNRIFYHKMTSGEVVEFKELTV